MESSFTPTEELLNARVAQQDSLENPIPYQEILLTRLCMHVHGKLLESRNNMLRAQGVNETLFMALMILDTKESHSIQPSELSAALGSSRTNATRIADELEKNGWIERKESHNDRRCLHLHLTEKGSEFLSGLLPPQHKALIDIWSSLDIEEKQQLDKLMRKLLSKLDNMKDQ
ncbi:transcriptional repressor MprA [Providencia rustigianii]|uniref:Transcriptional repressor MprA n=1 Tax=Providencia rustigianii TaxID=158850 RepID=A0A379G162_9GAMM|nr:MULTISPECIES: transcriptional repressor MprA [Providencia]MTC58109.1 transcriptional repressor MprA [Providencia rustigianii]SPY76823.1 transcriptional repressor MprA [Providencia rustigianii]SUC26050.1 transcriptional repressor MprA [Providencia rustigianii]SUC34750.1 transcriptional repressor MprA [Providencia rustigianii]VEB67009.1 transcriptional repressor MprA [Providencia rustigianii]